MIVAVSAVALALLGVGLMVGLRHQFLLKERAGLMRDAMRHRDFSFRLPVKGLLFGERALQNAVNDMGHEIEKLVAHNEVESWQRLTRVLTHEIMNVITPIRSISQAYLADPEISGSRYEEGIRAIRDTSDGLAAFVENYRKLTQLQEPVMRNFNLREFLGGIMALYPALKWMVAVPSGLMIRADESMLCQVFINIMKNAVEADAKTIGISYSGSPESFGTLYISNDGHSIPDDVAREIFIPFFTTKQTGSGIGLSLSRQVLLRQGLLLSLSPAPAIGYNVTFILESDRQ